MPDQKEAAAAEVLLERARREQEEIEQRIAWLESLAAHYGGPEGETADEDQEQSDDGEIDPNAYGGMKKAVHLLMARENKRLKIDSIARLIMDAQIRSDHKSAMSSARNAIRALIKSGDVKKAGAFYKVLVAP